MVYWTWGELRDKIEKDFDLQEEPDILASGELVGYLNDAIDKIEQHFIKLGDYFFSVSDPITLVEGQQDYDLPEDIYATKIRQIICDGEYEVKRIRDIRRIPIAGELNGDYYKYIIINKTGQAPKLRLYPEPLKGDGGSLEIYYTRNATRITGDDDDQEIDIPEAMNYIIAYIKMRIYEKEKNQSMFESYKGELKQHEEDLLAALGARVDDEENVIEPDADIYFDMVGSHPNL